MRTRRVSLASLVVVLVLAASAASQWWAARHERRIGSRVAEVARAGDIRMLSSETCAICHVARGWFRDNGVAFSECLIEHDAACRAEFEATRSPGTPVIVVRGRPQIGFDPGRLLRALQPGG